MGTQSATSLAPGFRFHPTDEELVWYYLKRKVTGKRLRFDPISEIDIYKSEPWDLPGKSRLRTRDLEWYFFSALDRKYGNGSKTNRATEKGYWKTTGKDRPIYHTSRTVGMKKTLVYHSGRAPRGQRSNWVMHEYRLVDEELEKAGISQDSFVLCRIFQKSGPGPKNGEQYGAPFVEEEWEDDEVAVFPDQAEMGDEVVIDNDAYAETGNVAQDVDVGMVSGDDPPAAFFYHGESSNSMEHSGELNEDTKFLVDLGESHDNSNRLEDQKYFVLPEQYQMDVKAVKREFASHSGDNVNPEDAKFLIDGQNMEAGDCSLENGSFLESHDLSSPLEADLADFNVEDYLTFCDADDNNFLSFDSSQLKGVENLDFDDALVEELLNGGNEQMLAENQAPLENSSDNDASSSKHYSEIVDPESKFEYSFTKQGGQMLGSFASPPAFASELSMKDAALHVNAASPSSIHVTAGWIRISDLNLVGRGVEWSVGKGGEINAVLSLGQSLNDFGFANPIPAPAMPARKTTSVVAWGWFYLLFVWVVLLSVSVKVATSIHTR